MSSLLSQVRESPLEVISPQLLILLIRAYSDLYDLVSLFLPQSHLSHLFLLKCPVLLNSCQFLSEPFVLCLLANVIS